jgi:hypothetical protein
MAFADHDRRHAPGLPIRLATSWLTNASVRNNLALDFTPGPWQIAVGRPKLRRG